MSDQPTDADVAEAHALAVAEELLRLMLGVWVPNAEREDWLPERLSFLLARENFRQCLAATREGHDIVAGNLARALFEEAIRWSWVDEDRDARRTAFAGAAALRHSQVEEDARGLGIDPSGFYGPIAAEVVDAAEGAVRFPRQVEGQLEWGLGELSAMMYTQYRLLSQYAHSSLLASASIAKERDGQLVVTRLPQPARMTILRNAVANMAVIVDGCKDGLEDRRPRPHDHLNLEAWRMAASVADALQPFAPATS